MSNEEPVIDFTSGLEFSQNQAEYRQMMMIFDQNTLEPNISKYPDQISAWDWNALLQTTEALIGSPL